ncbi:winged helix-turn-helix domain-containing protein [Holospora undulata]|uniref:Winged helix-turn helix domain-containing protein n=1 Tax=Holospora undulata HU1 TaxID=1321371 RepID=A0A061JHH1_9PROT|nr:winged helix-turn-helix domain-containing protein [Holospora undulata]ETZ04847.1 hypothetical protein K737_300725 [Holospora undulata HU1]
MVSNGGYVSKLNTSQTAELIAHLESHHVYKSIVKYSVCSLVFLRQGKTSWLRAHNFSFKKPAARPAKEDSGKREAFIHYYRDGDGTVRKVFFFSYSLIFLTSN